MKYIIYAIILFTFAIVVAKLSHYEERMKTYNAHVCSVNGYKPDCKTKL